MEELLRFLNLLKTLNLQRIIEDTLTELSPEIIKLNQEQLLKGEDSDGVKLPGYSSLYYLNLKSKMGSISGNHYDLKFSGKLYNKMYTYFENNIMNVDSKSETRDYMVDLIGTDFFGVQDKNLQNLLNNKGIPIIFKKIERHLQIS